MKEFHRLLSLSLLLSCVCGCAFRAKPIDPNTQAVYRSQILSQFSDGHTAPEALALAQSIAREIGARLLYDSPATEIAIDVVDTPSLFCFGYPGGIIISTGLVRRMHSESMFAFVIGHELAHHLLGHYDDLDLSAKTPGSEYSPSRELAADRRAIALMASAAYDVRGSVAAIGALGPVLHGAIGELTDRQSAAQVFIEESGWRPPGTISRRIYQELLSGL